MTRIPATALLLSVAGLIPFLLSAMYVLGMFTAESGGLTIGPFSFFNTGNGQLLMARYGVIILCFMSGVLWGFATKATGAQAAAAYALSVVPALWVFLNPGTRADEVLLNLGIGFAGLLALDYAYYRWELAPRWWMLLRLPLTLAVLICLAIGIWG